MASSVQDLAAQQPQKRSEIWKGIFTDAQVGRGMAVFQAHCASCHDPNEQGEAPPLFGDTFMRNWEGRSVGRLYSKILEQMPANNAQSVTPSEKLDVVAFILHENEFPSGTNELTADTDALSQIQMLPEGGAALPRTGAMVQVVGCLTQRSATEWAVTSSTEPVVTTLTAEGASDVTKQTTGALGTRAVKLLHVFPSPDAQKGHRIQAKGFLVREGADELAINVVSLQSIAPACP